MKIINEREIFKINPDYIAELVELRGIRVLVVDNFNKNPESIRDLVLNIPFSKFSPNRSTHVNKDSNVNITYDMRCLSSTYSRLINEYFPNEIYGDSMVNNILNNHPFTVNLAQSKDRNIIPKKSSSDGFFSEIFLNIESEYSWGSSFYSNDNNCVGVIPMEFNRMLLFDNKVFHNSYMEKNSYIDDNYRISQHVYINESLVL